MTGRKSDPDNKKMRYTKVSNEDALNHDRATREYEAAQGNLDRGAPPTASSVRPATCGHNVYFDTASATLDQREKQKLDAIAACLKRTHSDETLVVGSADPRGSARENEELGRERARNVAAYLRALGVPEQDIRIRSRGEERASGDPEHWPMNRQAEVEGR